MPKAKSRGERQLKRKPAPWTKPKHRRANPVPPIGTTWVLRSHLSAYWGGIGVGTLVKVVEHTHFRPPGVKVEPVDKSHPIFGKIELAYGNIALHIPNEDLPTALREP